MSLFPKLFAAAAIAATLVMGATTAAMAGPYSIVWGGGAHLGLGEVPEGNNGTFNAREIFPIMKAHPSGGFYTAPQYYSYSTPFGASVNTPDQIEQSQVASFFLFDDGNELSMFSFFDVPNDGNGGHVFADITSAGLAGNPNVHVSVRDDPGDSSYAWDTANGTSNPNWRWTSCCTDGMVLSGLPDEQGNTWGLDFDFLSYEGIDTFRIYTLTDAYENGNPTITHVSIPAAQISTVIFRRIEEQAAAIPAPAGMLFPLAAIGLMAIRRRNR
jgi:hypothetical protein